MLPRPHPQALRARAGAASPEGGGPCGPACPSARTDQLLQLTAPLPAPLPTAAPEWHRVDMGDAGGCVLQAQTPCRAPPGGSVISWLCHLVAGLGPPVAKPSDPHFPGGNLAGPISGGVSGLGQADPTWSLLSPLDPQGRPRKGEATVTPPLGLQDSEWEGGVGCGVSPAWWTRVWAALSPPEGQPLDWGLCPVPTPH